MKKSRQVPQQAVAHLLYWIFSNEKSLQIGLQDGVAKEHKVDEFQVFYEVVGHWLAISDYQSIITSTNKMAASSRFATVSEDEFALKFFFSLF